MEKTESLTLMLLEDVQIRSQVVVLWAILFKVKVFGSAGFMKAVIFFSLLRHARWNSVLFFCTIEVV